MNKYLVSTEYFDFNHPKIDILAQQIKGTSAKEIAVDIYYLVRDAYAYNPYRVFDGINSFKASFCLETGDGYCIPKAALMIALCRKKGIPARLGLADVLNHLATPKLLELIDTDVFSMHGYVDIYVGGQWVKATPAFNRSLCEKMNTLPLEFNGEQDSIFHEFTENGEKHMEYLNDWGTFPELPVDFIMKNLSLHYPHLINKMDDKLLANNPDLALK